MKTIALRRLAELNPPTPQFDALPPDRDVLFLPLEAVWADERADQTRRAAKSAVANGYTRFHAGDIVSPKVTPTFQAGRTMIARAVGAGTTELHVLRARAGVDPRWVAYALRSNHYLGEGVTAFQGVAGLQRVPENFIAEFRIADVDREEQRRIADFLDDRVARIDQIIAARQVEAQNAAAARDAEWARITGALPGSRVPLRRFLVSIVDGPFGSSLTSNHYADSGTRVIRLGNLGIAQFRDQDSAYISDEYAASLTQHAVQPGDLLMAGLGDERWPLGRCAVAPRDLGPAIVKADCYRIRLDDRIDHDFASAYLSSPPSRGEIALAARGATRARLNTVVARTAPLAPVSQGAQIAYARDVARLQENEARMRRGLDAQVALLQEYKQCLITAAVTGEFDVTTASTRIPG